MTIRLLKNSPLNRVLMDLYNYQQTSSAYTGQNVLVLSNPHGVTITSAKPARS